MQEPTTRSFTIHEAIEINTDDEYDLVDSSARVSKAMYEKVRCAAHEPSAPPARVV